MLRKIILSLTIFSISVAFADINFEELNKDIKNQCVELGIDALNQYPENKEKQKEFILTEGKIFVKRFSYLNDEKLINKFIYPNCIEYAFDYVKENKGE